MCNLDNHKEKFLPHRIIIMRALHEMMILSIFKGKSTPRYLSTLSKIVVISAETHNGPQGPSKPHKEVARSKH